MYKIMPQKEGANIDTVIYGVLCGLEEDVKTTGGQWLFFSECLKIPRLIEPAGFGFLFNGGMDS